MGKDYNDFNENYLQKFTDAIEACSEEEYKKIVIIDDYEFSDNFKREINKIFRKYFDAERALHPEVEE